jgi:hypothetical protein
MKNNFLKLKIFAVPSASNLPEQPVDQAPSRRLFGKKLYITIAAVVAIAVILAAVFFIPSSNAEVISLGAHYSVGEKLTYEVTASVSSDAASSSTNVNTKGTLVVDVLNFEGDTYTINYSSTLSLAGISQTTSHIIEVKEMDMVNLLTLLPVALQQYATNTDSNSPIGTAFFNQTTAKVGDTWQIPLSTSDSSSATAAEMTVKFVGIQNMAVKAGDFKVFRIDFSTNVQETQNSQLSFSINVSGQSYLEMGTCKQIQSTLDLNMNGNLGSNANYNLDISFTSTLTQDLKP